MVLEHNCTEQLVVFSSTWHKIVDVETGRKVREIYDQDGFVSAVCWSPTNVNIFASAGTDSSIRFLPLHE
jgi:WD40 repeat protein